MKRHKALPIFLVVVLLGATSEAQVAPPAPQGQRQGGPRSGGPAAPNPDLVGEIKLILAPVDRIAPFGPQSAINGTWWTNTALLSQLGLTEVQKARIQNAFESHRQGLVSSKESLEKEEAQLARLLEAESIDRPAVFGQINRVIQARSELERTNATMTLEMREQLTRAQWTQLQARTSVTLQNIINFTEGGRGARGTPETVAPGQRRGGGQP